MKSTYSAQYLIDIFKPFPHTTNLQKTTMRTSRQHYGMFHNGKCNYWIELKTLWQKEKLLVLSNFSFTHNVFKSRKLKLRQNASASRKGFIIMNPWHCKGWNLRICYRIVVWEKVLTLSKMQTHTFSCLRFHWITFKKIPVTGEHAHNVICCRCIEMALYMWERVVTFTWCDWYF